MRCLFATWRPINGSPGPFTGGPLKVVHHKTQGASVAGALAAYRANRSDPHFTVHALGVDQHIEVDHAARSLKNAPGGVQTNFDGAIQIEVVGFSGTTADAATLLNLVRLLKWLRDALRIPWVWPEGRPPTGAATGYGLGNGNRHPATWDSSSGQYGHSQVPENQHWDPAYTDDEWAFLNDRMGSAAPSPVPTPDDFKDKVMALPVLRQGATGQQVRILQGLLIAHAEDIVAYAVGGFTRLDEFVNGTFDARTEGVLKAWQERTQSLDADGVAGPATWAWLVGV